MADQHPGYAELHCYSCFSFHRGASSVEALHERAAELGLAALAITDRDGLYGAVRQWKASEASLSPRPIYGAELCLEDGARLVALVRDREGWANLSALISESRTHCEKGSAFLPFSRLVERRAGLTVLSGGRFGPVDRALLGIDGSRAMSGWEPKGPWGRSVGAWTLDPEPAGPPQRSEPALALAQARLQLDPRARQRDDAAPRLRRAVETAARYRDAFGDHFLLELQDHLLPEDQWLRALLRQISEELGIPRVASGAVHYALPKDRPLQDVMSCVRLHTTLRDAGTRLLPNGHFVLKSPRAMAQLFADDPAAIARTLDVAADCRFSFTELPYSFPVYPVPEGHGLQSYLEQLTWEGAAHRYGDRLGSDARIRAQLEHELQVVGRLGLAGYFLIVWDISEECRRRGILSQGRGSAANSCVCYCLGITAVDPIQLDLLFERFLSEARGGWPDIDIDISNSMREEILQFVYEKYGREHCAMVCNVISYHPRSALRDVGKAFGLGLDQVDRMAKALDHHTKPEALADAFGPEGEGLISEDGRLLKQVLHYSEQLCGMPRHLGIHSGGIVISGQPIGEACPVENASMPDRTVLQWDKDDVAHAELVKIDLLALGMLSVIQEATRLLAAQGSSFDMAQLSYDDPEVYDMICEADTIGLFQIESRAQINTLPRLRPRRFHDLVVEVALIRPGPIQGDMVHPYLRRRQGKEEVTYAHPSLRPILERTLGIPLFQEQAMKMAITAAGFSPGEADRLRKVMGFKRGTEEMERLFNKMVRGMLANGFDRETAEQVRGQLRGFAAYGFPESHAASFALIVYASGYLKRFHPAAFYAGLLNCQPMGFYSPATLVGDARRHGVIIEALCVNRSEWRWQIDPGVRGEGARLRPGFLQIKGLGEEHGARIEAARRSCGPFRSTHDFCERCELDHGALGKLAEAGAFGCFGIDRRQALWEVSGYRKRLPLEGPPRQAVLPGFPVMNEAELNVLDHGVSGFSPRQHPLCFLRSRLRGQGVVDSGQLALLRHQSQAFTAGLVITRQRPRTAKGTFFITMEDEVGLINVIVHNKTFERHPRLLRKVRLLACKGRVQVQQGVVQIVATWFQDLAHDLAVQDLLGCKEGWEEMPSRDFQ